MRNEVVDRMGCWSRARRFCAPPGSWKDWSVWHIGCPSLPQLSDLPHLWDHAQLLQETQQIGATPMLHDLSLAQMIYILGRDRDGLASWRNVLKLARLGAAKGSPHGNGISFGNHLLNGDLPIRKGRVKAVDKVLELCWVRG